MTEDVDSRKISHRVIRQGPRQMTMMTMVMIEDMEEEIAAFGLR